MKLYKNTYMNQDDSTISTKTPCYIVFYRDLNEDEQNLFNYINDIGDYKNTLLENILYAMQESKEDITINFEIEYRW